MRFARFMIMSISILVIVCYVYNKSIINYLTQTYHIDIDIHDSYISNFLSFGSNIASFLESIRTFDDNEISVNNIEYESTPQIDFTQTPAQEENHEIKQETQEIIENTKRIEENKLYVESGDTFLLIGDSMMQGIGVTLVSRLRKKGFKVINIARQSTGLTYKGFFDWESTLQATLKKNPQVSVIVVCLGANDPWSVNKIKFGSTEWSDMYNGRIEHIYEIAKAHNALVVWYEVPAIKNARLNAKVKILNDFYASNARKYGGLFINAGDILLNNNFTYYMNINGKSTAVRSKDGIHFTTQGSLILTRSLLDTIEIIDK